MAVEAVPSFESLASELGPQLGVYLTRMVGNAADGDELLQETLLRIARGLPQFEGRASVKNWAYRIASNVAIDFLRKSGRANFEELGPHEDVSDLDVEDDLVLDEMNDCVRQVIDTLPPDYRAALVLFNLEGKSVAETAQILDISESAAKVRVHRGKLRLREALDQECDFYVTSGGTVRCDRKEPPEET